MTYVSSRSKYEIAFFTLLFLLIAHSGYSQFTTLDDARSQAEILCRKTFEANDLPGMAVAVSTSEGTIWSGGYGYSSIESQAAVDPDSSLFRIGSVSKSITSAALAALLEEGKLGLDDLIHHHLPGFPAKRYPMTIRQVAGHIAGVRHYRGMEFISNTHYENIDDALKVFESDTLLFEPGSQYSYSSYGWNLLSALIEKAAGEPFLGYLDRSVFERGEIEFIHPEIKGRYDDHLVDFYMKNQGQVVPALEVDNSIKWAGGGLIGSAEGLMQFGRAVLTELLMSHATFLEFTTPLVLNNGKSTNYGIGWRVGEDKKGRRWIGHGGGSMGGTTMFVIYPDYDLCIATLVNMSNAQTNDLAWRVAQQFISFKENK